AKAFNCNDLGYVDSFRSRCFEEVMLPTGRKLEDWYGRTNEEQQELNDYRDDCWLLALQEWPAFEEHYAVMKKDAASLREDTVPLPILAALKVLAPDKVEACKEHCAKAGRELIESIASNDWDTALYNVLFEAFNRQPLEKDGEFQATEQVKRGEFKVTDLAEKLQTTLREAGLLKEDKKITPQRLGRMLKRIGLEGELVRAKNVRSRVFTWQEIEDCRVRFPYFNATLPYTAASASLEEGGKDDLSTLPLQAGKHSKPQLTKSLKE
ncbi:unnamed protein product, partial [marine sediment metagenome]